MYFDTRLLIDRRILSKTVLRPTHSSLRFIIMQREMRTITRRIQTVGEFGEKKKIILYGNHKLENEIAPSVLCNLFVKRKFSQKERTKCWIIIGLRIEIVYPSSTCTIYVLLLRVGTGRNYFANLLPLAIYQWQMQLFFRFDVHGIPAEHRRNKMYSESSFAGYGMF